MTVETIKEWPKTGRRMLRFWCWEVLLAFQQAFGGPGKPRCLMCGKRLTRAECKNPHGVGKCSSKWVN